jgi:hypothetical protein
MITSVSEIAAVAAMTMTMMGMMIIRRIINE